MKHKIYSAGAEHFRLKIPYIVTAQFERYQQTGPRDFEAGGQLYTKDPTADEVFIGYASPPRWADVRGRTTFVMNAKAASTERATQFKEGYHCIGLWHTHPEVHPKPSPADLRVMKEMAKHANELNTFLHIIVGTESTWVAGCDRSGKIIVFKELPPLIADLSGAHVQ